MVHSDIVLVNVTRRIISRIEKWRESLESKEFRIGRGQKHSVWNIILVKPWKNEGIMHINGQEIPKNDYFHFLGPVINHDGRIEEDVPRRKAGWLKVKLLLGYY